jgi:hypothetical protein
LITKNASINGEKVLTTCASHLDIYERYPLLFYPYHSSTSTMKSSNFFVLFHSVLVMLLCSNGAYSQQSIDYKTGNPADWPKMQDAVTAAPAHHKILMENEKVRVLEVTLLPGVKEPLHHHQWPSVLYIQSAGEFIDYDEAGKIIFDTRTLPAPLVFPMTMYKEPEAPHAVENLSKTITIKLIRVEMKR